MPGPDFGKMYSKGVKVLPDGHNKSLKKSQILYLTDLGRLFTDFAQIHTRLGILWIIIGSGPGFMKKLLRGCKRATRSGQKSLKKAEFFIFELQT